MANIALPLFVIAFGLTGVIVAIIRSKRHMQSAKPHALLDYFLLWPLILDQPAPQRKSSGWRTISYDGRDRWNGIVRRGTRGWFDTLLKVLGVSCKLGSTPSACCSAQ
jgi:hypothetical protein